jgi:hypothetical protein
MTIHLHRQRYPTLLPTCRWFPMHLLCILKIAATIRD